MPKPKGTIGSTKMKILAIICYNYEAGIESYGYNIWQSLKQMFYIYLNDCDVRNVYHHLKELCDQELLERLESDSADSSQRCFYQLTDDCRKLERSYAPYLKILRQTPIKK